MAGYTQAMGATGEMVGGIIGMLMAEKNYAEINRLRQEAQERFGKVDLPTLEKLAVERMGPSRLEGVRMDQKYKGAQDEALDRLMNISREGGMDAKARAQLNEAKNAAFGVNRGLAGSALSRLARRGQMNTGMAAQADLSGAQAGADRAYQGSISTAADASDRALRALMAGGGMATGMGAADLGQKNRAAGAGDRIEQFNLGRIDSAGRFNRGLENQRFTNAMGKARAMNSVGDQMADDQFFFADNTQKKARGVGKGVGATAGAGADFFSEKTGGAFF